MNGLYKGMVEIKQELRELRKEIHEPLHQITTRTTTPNTSRSNLKSIEKKVLNKLDTIQLCKAISHYIEEGYRTAQIRDEVMNRFNIKPTCFYKYLKEVRTKLYEVTSHEAIRSNFARSYTK